VIVTSPKRIRATITVPGDKSISHRSLILNGIARGPAQVTGILDSDDVRATAACMAALGVDIDWPADSTEAIVTGGGLHGLYEADDVLDCGNSGTSMRLLTGLLAANPLLSILTGDESLRSRPMARVVRPLREMGATILGRRGDTLAPLAIKGGDLRGISYEGTVASAQVKSALLLAGLYADGGTRVTQPTATRDHTERMLSQMGVNVTSEGTRVDVEPAQQLDPLPMRVPGDISSAAPWLVLGACHPDAEIVLQGVNTNETRTGILDIMRSMGASIEFGEDRSKAGEPATDLVVRSSSLHGTEVSGDLVARAIDELPLVAVLAAAAEGETVVRGAEELLVKESNRVEAVVRMMSRMGADIRALADGFVVTGPTPLHGARVDGLGDHRIGMVGAIAGAIADGETNVTDDAVSVSYPGFWDELERSAGQLALRS
jgi:3-phosphoshikimate 1-carboxyvinyltransferase